MTKNLLLNAGTTYEGETANAKAKADQAAAGKSAAAPPAQSKPAPAPASEPPKKGLFGGLFGKK